MTAALDEPLDYPPLCKTATPGDRVVLAIGTEFPSPPKSPRPLSDHSWRRAWPPTASPSSAPGRTWKAASSSPCRLLEKTIGQRIVTVTHDPRDRAGMAYLAATDAGAPIMLNRLLTDADVVLPIGCMHGEKTTGYFGIHTAVFPTFSDHETLARFRRLDALGINGPCKGDLKGEVENVAWLLGVNFTIQLVPAAGDRVLHVVAGRSEAVHRRSRELYDAAWSCLVARRASLVVAAIEGSSVQQTWENLGRTLETAGTLVEDGGAIAVCCDLAAAPGPGVQRLAGARSREKALRHIRKDRPADALPAAQLAQAARSRPGLSPQPARSRPGRGVGDDAACRRRRVAPPGAAARLVHSACERPRAPW